MKSSVTHQAGAQIGGGLLITRTCPVAWNIRDPHNSFLSSSGDPSYWGPKKLGLGGRALLFKFSPLYWAPHEASATDGGRIRRLNLFLLCFFAFLGLLDHLISDIAWAGCVVRELHRELTTARCHSPKRADVAEHFR